LRSLLQTHRRTVCRKRTICRRMHQTAMRLVRHQAASGSRCDLNCSINWHRLGPVRTGHQFIGWRMAMWHCLPHFPRPPAPQQDP
jgi:hypothetical protein